MDFKEWSRRTFKLHWVLEHMGKPAGRLPSEYFLWYSFPYSKGKLKLFSWNLKKKYFNVIKWMLVWLYVCLGLCKGGRKTQVVRLPLNLLCRWGGPGSSASVFLSQGFYVCPIMPGLWSAAMGASWSTTVPMPFLNGDIAEIYRWHHQLLVESRMSAFAETCATPTCSRVISQKRSRC